MVCRTFTSDKQFRWDLWQFQREEVKIAGEDAGSHVSMVNYQSGNPHQSWCFQWGVEGQVKFKSIKFNYDKLISDMIADMAAEGDKLTAGDFLLENNTNKKQTITFNSKV